MREQERTLLEYFGPDYYQVQDIRARVKTLGNLIASKKKDLGRVESLRRAESAPARPEISSGTSPQAGKTSAADAGHAGSGRVSSGSAPPAGKTPATGNLVPVVPAQAAEDHGAARRQVPATAKHTHAPAPHEDKEAREWEGRSAAFLGTLTFSVIVGLSVGLAIQFAILLWLLHRLAGRSNALIRLDGVNPASSPSGQSVENPGIAPSEKSSENKLLMARIRAAQPRVLSEQAPLPGTRDDLEDALVQELCQQNVWLREQIDQLETVTA